MGPDRKLLRLSVFLIAAPALALACAKSDEAPQTPTPEPIKTEAVIRYPVQELLDEFNSITDYKNRNYDLGYQGSIHTSSFIFRLGQYKQKTIISIASRANPSEAEVYEINNGKVVKKEDGIETELQDPEIDILRQRLGEAYEFQKINPRRHNKTETRTN